MLQDMSTTKTRTKKKTKKTQLPPRRHVLTLRAILPVSAVLLSCWLPVLLRPPFFSSSPRRPPRLSRRVARLCAVRPTERQGASQA